MAMTRLQSTGSALGLLSLALFGCSGGNGAATPPGVSAVVGCYYEKCLPTSSPSGGGTSTPSGGGTSTPSGGGTSTPSGGGTSTPTGGGTSTPTSGGTSTPSGGGTSTPTGGGTSTPSGGGTATPTGGGTSTPTGGGTATPIPSPTATLGTLSLNPTLLVPVGVTNPASAQTTATQSGYSGAYVPSISCPVNLPAGAITVSASGDVITVDENPALVPVLGANVFCTLTVMGGGGQSATANVLLAATVLPSSTASPSGTPAPGATPGALTVAPGLIVPVGVTNPGTATAQISQVNFDGPFTAAVTCPVNLPTGAVTATVADSTVTITENSSLLSGVAGASILCTLTVTGGGGMTGTSNVLLGANVAS